MIAAAAAAATTEVDALSRALEFVRADYAFALWCGLGSALVGLCCALVGSFLVLRRMSLIGDVLGHAMLPGVVIAFMVVGTRALLPLYAGALATGLLAAFAFGFVVRHSRTRPDAALGLVLTAFFGLGIVLLSRVQNDPSGEQAGLANFLFGNALALRPDEVLGLAALALVSLVSIALLLRPLAILSFDPGYARSVGVPTATLHYGLMALTSLVTVASIGAVGVVLVVAMLITPAATAFMLVRRLPWMLVVAGVIGAISGYLGALSSYVLDGFSSGPTMVLVASTFFALAALLSPTDGLLVRALRRRRRRRTATAAPAPEGAARSSVALATSGEEGRR